MSSPKPHCENQPPADTAAAPHDVDTERGIARFPSVRTMVEADLRGWLPLTGVFFDDDLIELIPAEAEVACAST